MSSHKQNFSWALQKEWVLTIRRWSSRASLAVQWLALSVFTGVGLGSTPGWGSYMVQSRKKSPGFSNFLLVQWLRCCAGCWGLIPGQGTRPHMQQLRVFHSATKSSPHHNLRSHMPQQGSKILHTSETQHSK